MRFFFQITEGRTAFCYMAIVRYDYMSTWCIFLCTYAIIVYRLLRARRALMLFNDIQLRARRVPSPYRFYTATTSFWFSREHRWTVLTPFWLSKGVICMLQFGITDNQLLARFHLSQQTSYSGISYILPWRHKYNIFNIVFYKMSLVTFLKLCLIFVSIHAQRVQTKWI